MITMKMKEKGDERRKNLNRHGDQHERAAGNKEDHEDKGGQHQDKKDRLGKQKKAEFSNFGKPAVKPESKPKGNDDRAKEGAKHGNRGKGTK